MKPRFAVDLNEIERQIAQAQSAPAQPAASGGRSDPLVELARIVGQEDPFQSLLANDAPARPRAAPAAASDGLFAVRPGTGQAGASYAAPAHDARAYDTRSYAEPAPSASGQAYAYPAQDAAYDRGGYGQDYYGDGGDPRADEAYGTDYDAYEAPGKTRSRKGLIVVGAVLGAAVIGGGAAFMMGGSHAALGGGEPPLIKASNEPIKVQPQNPGGVEIPNQNKQIYERSNQNAETKVVSRAEQPVDVQQAVRMSASEATGATGGAQPPANGLNLGEPRKVRTVTVRPDGSMAHPEGAGAKPAAVAAAAPAMTMPAAAQPQAAPAPQPKPAAATPAASTPKPAPVAEAPSEPAAKPQPQRVASAQPAAVPAPAEPAASSGGFAVQLGLANSESAAQKVLSGFQKKYPDLEGQPALIRKAEVNGSTIYRVRVGPMSRDEAATLCSKVQGQGGQCFVAKN
ncbi:SPOR domain-containing protein [Microvirga thermotolerans]|uniref:SPOR domain-containing protein n=1 Tax=Microvirga thermotolerans TaxID=2651334 RepID=A0A5P9JUJ3_9HYPH|nr:SPOR domain-containing protein [Microvirga thermotolerans]QFU16277.1 SPOR domain-containing protein [Microvirga thermotolerans]